MAKRWQWAALLFSIFLTGCQASPAKTAAGSALPEVPGTADNGYRLVTATDLHYQPEVSDSSSSLIPQMKDIDMLVSCLLSEPDVLGADALLLCGDLSNSGLPGEPRALIKSLDAARQQGTQILVLPGNHDLNGISKEEFSSLYRDYGYESPFMADTASLSYVFRLADRFWILMMDTNGGSVAGAPGDGGISDETLLWVDHVLTEAENAGALVVSASHHTLLDHSSRQYSKLSAFENQYELRDLFVKHKVPLNIGGHLHKQHAAKFSSETDLYEITGGMLADYPNLCSRFTVSPETKSIAYQAQPLDVDGWALRNGHKEERLLHFSDYSRTCRQKNAFGLVGSMLSSMGIEGSDLDQLAVFWTDIYMDASDGTIRDTRSAYRDSSLYRTWLSYRDQSRYSEWLDFLLGEEKAPDSHALLISYEGRR